MPSVVVGVVGMGHVPGIEKNWTTDLNIQEIDLFSSCLLRKPCYLLFLCFLALPMWFP